MDDIWETIREEVTRQTVKEPLLASFLHATILNHAVLEDALSFHLAAKLEGPSLPAMLIRELMDETFGASTLISDAVRADLVAVRNRDPASHGYSTPFLYFKGFHALQAYRVAHHLWNEGRHTLGMHLQSRISAVFNVDIHPAARIGKGILVDHGTGVVIGETAVVEDNVSMLHEVTLGGTGKELGDRHPKIRRGVLIGAGAKVLGNIEVGECAKVGAGSVVLKDVPPHTTVAGVPAKVVGEVTCDEPSQDMDQNIPDELHQAGGSGI